MKKYFVLLCAALMVVACGKKKVHFADLTLSTDKDAYLLDDKLYDGEVWSADDAICLNFIDGLPDKESMKIYHENGKLLFDAKEQKYFDEDGKEMEMDGLIKYQQYIGDEVRAFAKEVEDGYRAAGGELDMDAEELPEEDFSELESDSIE